MEKSWARSGPVSSPPFSRQHRLDLSIQATLASTNTVGRQLNTITWLRGLDLLTVREYRATSASTAGLGFITTALKKNWACRLCRMRLLDSRRAALPQSAAHRSLQLLSWALQEPVPSRKDFRLPFQPREHLLISVSTIPSVWDIPLPIPD